VLLLAFAFSSFILSIIYINKQVTFFTTYAPAVAAFLAAGALHMLYNLWLVASGGRGKVNKSSTVLAIQGMFLAWYFGEQLEPSESIVSHVSTDANRFTCGVSQVSLSP
jgi:hypothetical protein